MSPCSNKTVHWFGSGIVWTLWTGDGFLVRIENHYTFCGAPHPELSLRQLNPTHIFTHYYEVHFKVNPQLSFNFRTSYSDRRGTNFRLHHSINGQFHCSLMSLLKEISVRAWTALTLILRRSRTGTAWFYTSTSNKRAARPKLYTKSLTRELKLMYSRLTLVRISINL